MKLHLCVPVVVALFCFTPQIAWSDCAARAKANLVPIEQKALLGDQNAAFEMWGFYGWGQGQECPDSSAKYLYWLQIGAENGGGLSYLEFSQVSQNYFSTPGKNEAGINGHIRGFYWAKMASLHPNTAQTYSSANDELSGGWPMRINYWKGVAEYFSFSPPAAKEAAQMEREAPSFIPLNTLGIAQQGNAAPDENPYNAIEINHDTLPILEMNALLGDASAAATLASYFQAAKNKNELYWRTIAAENGDVASQFWMAKQLGDSADSDDRIRAAFWATKTSGQPKDESLSSKP